MSLVSVTHQDFDETVISSPTPTLVIFVSAWCDACAQMLPIVENLSDDAAIPVQGCQINFDDNVETAVSQRVMMVPTIILYKGGKDVARLSGAQSREKLVEFIREVMSE